MSAKSSDPLVSVVIPFYNTDKYLAECIRSVLSQTFRNIEVILQDNCSTDRSWSIAMSFAETDGRIRLVRNETFLSQVQNYNAALRKISSESKYTKMVQADDTIYPRCLEEMVALAETDPTVGMVSSYSLNGTKVIQDEYPFDHPILSGRDVARHELLTDQGFHGSPTTVMYRSEIVRTLDPFYEEEDGQMFEDAENCFRVLEDWKFGFIKQVLTFCRVDPDSTMAVLTRMDPESYLIFSMSLTSRFGPKFLSEAEHQRRMAQVERWYFSYLSYHAWFTRNPAFWDYHRRALRRLGYSLGRTRVALLAAKFLLTLPVRPGQMKRVLDRMRAAWRPLASPGCPETGPGLGTVQSVSPWTASRPVSG